VPVVSLGGVDPGNLRTNSVFSVLRNTGSADVPGTWIYGTLTDTQVYLGQCFGRAYQWMNAQRARSHDPVPITSARLVHGIVHSRDPHGARRWLWHAWVDLPGDAAFDGVVQRFYTRGAYQAVTEAEKLAIYEWKTAKWLREHRRHFGPWYFAERSALACALERHAASESWIAMQGVRATVAVPDLRCPSRCSSASDFATSSRRATTDASNWRS
jgi:hypothetical protein